MAKIRLKPGRESSLLRRHPWIFSGAVEQVEGGPSLGQTVEIFGADGAFLASGAYCPHSQIIARVWSFDPQEEICPAFFQDRLHRATADRKPFSEASRGACRLVFGESDGLPGLIVDRYADFLVCQFLTAGAEAWRMEIVSHLEELLSPAGIYERSDAEVRRKEGLSLRKGVLSGQDPPAHIQIEEGPCRYFVDVREGHKTGFYLDQRDNRAAVARQCRELEVLDCFSYTGGFAVSALKAGAARVTSVESSAAILELARRNLGGNAPVEGTWEPVAGDVFQVLRGYRDSRRTFDAVVLDPPKFVESRSQLVRGSRGYKDINLLAFKLLRPGGLLFTFSCSGLVSAELFQKIAADAALDAGREARIIGRLFQAGDHPTLLSFPEGTYLKGLVCKVW